MEVQEKRSQENGPKAEKDKTERATGLGRRTREDIYTEKWDQTDSPEILYRGETSESLASLPTTTNNNNKRQEQQQQEEGDKQPLQRQQRQEGDKPKIQTNAELVQKIHGNPMVRLHPVLRYVEHKVAGLKPRRSL